MKSYLLLCLGYFLWEKSCCYESWYAKIKSKYPFSTFRSNESIFVITHSAKHGSVATSAHAARYFEFQCRYGKISAHSFPYIADFQVSSCTDWLLLQYKLGQIFHVFPKECAPFIWKATSFILYGDRSKNTAPMCRRIELVSFIWAWIKFNLVIFHPKNCLCLFAFTIHNKIS